MFRDRPVGRHLIAELTGLPDSTLHDAIGVMASLRSVLVDAGFTILKSTTHSFVERGQGFTGVVLLSESHAAVHTYPEYCYLALDIFGCGEADPNEALNRFVEELRPQKVRKQMVVRSPEQVVEQRSEPMPVFEGKQIHGR